MRRQLWKYPLLVFATAVCALPQGIETRADRNDWEEINFEFNSAILSDGFPSLLRMAELLNQHTDYKVKLEGHTDYVGSEGYNERLGRRRAEEVRSFLQKYGSRPGQIEIESEGKRRPRVDNRTKEGRFMNRRVTMTVTDGQGRIIGAGGISDALRGMQEQPNIRPLQDCCDAILKRLDKLDEIATMLRDLANQNAGLRQEVDNLKGEQQKIRDQIAGLPKPPTAGEITDITQKTASEAIERARMPRFSLLGVNIGADDRREVTFTGKARFFAPFKENFAVQVQGEYLYFKDRQEGQIDFGLVNRINKIQAGLFASFKNINLRNVESNIGPVTVFSGSPLLGTQITTPSTVRGNGTLGQGAFTFDYLFGRGKVGLFGTKAFLNNQVIQTTALTRTMFLESYLHAIDQVGVSTTVGLYKDVYLEGNLGYLKSFGNGDRPGGTLRFVFPLSDRWAVTVEGGMNETLLGRSNNGRAVAGIQWGNFVRPKEYLSSPHPVPVDVPRVRYEVLTRRVRNGNDPPVADAGPDQIGIAAGPVSLDGSNSYDPEGDPITFAWSQIAGPAVSLSGANTARASFNSTEGNTYAFRLTVRDDKGASSAARVTITTQRTPQVRILRFIASPQQINAGQASLLTWQVENAESVSIDGIGNVNPQAGSTSVSPQMTTSYRLTARNSVSEVSETVTVTVNRPAVRIIFFQASPMNVVQGGSSTLSWQTENADQVEISGIGAVAQQGSTVVTPTEQTTYTLTARNAFGSTTAQVVIQVTAAPMPRIVRFTAAPTEILVGEQASLVWQVENATDVVISDVGPVAMTGSTNVSPGQTTTYTLTARNQSGEVSAQATVTVIPLVRIVQFVANPATSPRPGAPVVLTWTTENATDVSIDGIGVVPPNGSVTVNPASETTYTLRAFGRRSQTTATVTVRVNTPPVTGGGPIANAGPDQVTTQREIKLDGSRSISPEGLVIGFSWRAIGRQPELLLGADTATPTVRFANLAFGEYVFELTVTDSSGRFAKDTTKVFFGAF